MIALIRGRLIAQSEGELVVETAAGVGYRLQVSEPTISRLAGVAEEEVSLWVTTRIKDDSILLYGFAERREQDLFQHLIKVSGVGPKLALAIISASEYDDLLSAIVGKDAASLARIPGVGKKLSQRLVLELAESMAKDLAAAVSVRPTPFSRSTADLSAALSSLGYTEREFSQPAARLLKENPEAGLEDLIRMVLKELHGNP